jgi:glycosyltransferase involved in cell wall biosynthesis
MRVVLVNKYAHLTGGADRHVLLLRRALEERGHSVVLVSTTGGEADFEVPVTVTHDTRDALSPVRQSAVALSALWNRHAARLTVQAIESFKPHVLHAHKLYPQLSVAPIAVTRRRRVPIVQTVHDYEFISANPLDHSGRRFDQSESRLSYRLLNDLTFVVRRRVHASAVDEWISVSDAVARLYRARGIQTTVLPNFVEPAAHDPAASRSGVVFIGRLTEEKGVRHVIALARELRGTEVSIAGWGQLAPVVQDAAEELENLQFSGRIGHEAVTRMLARARVAVIPSLWEEPGAIVVLEAMATGTPLVVYRTGGIADYVEDAGAGLVVDPNVADMHAAVERLLHDHTLWSTCSRCALDAVRSRHSVTGYVDRLVEIYERALARP